MSGAGYVAVGVGCFALGWLCALVLPRLVGRRFSEADHAQQPDPLEREVVRRSSTGFLVLNHLGRPLLSNDRAADLGVLNGGIVAAPILEAAARVAVSGEPVDVELRPDRPPSLTASAVPTAVLAVVQSIGDDRILVSAADESAAQRVEAARRDFVANVSHELKTPVAAIGLLAEVAADAADDPESVRHFAERLRSEANRLGVLVSELITLSRLQGGDPPPEPTVVEVDAVVAESVARLASAAQGAGITIVADRPSGLLVRGDRALLIMALTNLISNAINYSPSGTQVSISRTLVDRTVGLAVTDRGVGIAPEHTDRVFERFFRVDPARSRSTGGTGLGLAIVRQVAANHGGTVTVWSRPGTGSTFTLTLPVCGTDGHVPQTDIPTAAATAPLAAPRGAA